MIIVNTRATNGPRQPLPFLFGTSLKVLLLYIKKSYLYAPCRKFDPDGRLRLQVEFVAGETRQQVTLADSGISDENDCKTRKDIYTL